MARCSARSPGCGRSRSADLTAGSAAEGDAAARRRGWSLLEGHADRAAGRALALFAAARASRPQDPLALAGEGIARAMGGDAAGAEPLLRGALAHAEQLAPRNRLALTRFALANLLFDAGRGAEAEPEYRAAATAAATSAGRAAALVRIATIALDGDRLDDADSALGVALAGAPDYAQAHYLRATLLRRRGATADAERELRLHALLKAVDEAGRHSPPDVDEVLRLRSELIAAWPECAVFRLDRIRFEIDAGRYAQAQAEAAALLESAGPSAPVAFLLARAHAGRGDLAAATEARALALRLDPAAPSSRQQVLADWRRGGRFSERPPRARERRRPAGAPPAACAPERCGALICVWHGLTSLRCSSTT